MKNRYECNDCGVVFNLEILEGADDDDEIYCPICSASLSDENYEKALMAARAELGRLCRAVHFQGKSALILFEGPDAAGKGGAIRRLTGSMDARDYRVIR